MENNKIPKHVEQIWDLILECKKEIEEEMKNKKSIVVLKDFREN